MTTGLLWAIKQHVVDKQNCSLNMVLLVEGRLTLAVLSSSSWYPAGETLSWFPISEARGLVRSLLFLDPSLECLCVSHTLLVPGSMGKAGPPATPLHMELASGMNGHILRCRRHLQVCGPRKTCSMMEYISGGKGVVSQKGKNTLGLWNQRAEASLFHRFAVTIGEVLAKCEQSWEASQPGPLPSWPSAFCPTVGNSDCSASRWSFMTGQFCTKPSLSPACFRDDMILVFDFCVSLKPELFHVTLLCSLSPMCPTLM